MTQNGGRGYLPYTSVFSPLMRICQIIGPVVDIAAVADARPQPEQGLTIYDAITVGAVTCEVQQLLGNGVARTVAMSGTDGLKRGMAVTRTGDMMRVPVGNGTLGRIFNVLGQPVDGRGPVHCESSLPIHRSAPSFIDLDTNLAIF